MFDLDGQRSIASQAASLFQTDAAGRRLRGNVTPHDRAGDTKPFRKLTDGLGVAGRFMRAETVVEVESSDSDCQRRQHLRASVQ
jgi:hypothetical protein